MNFRDSLQIYIFYIGIIGAILLFTFIGIVVPIILSIQESIYYLFPFFLTIPALIYLTLGFIDYINNFREEYLE